jgi:CBS domain-containing protein
MIAPAITINRSASVSEALRTMRELGVETLVVVQPRGETFGLVTLREIRSKVGGAGKSSDLWPISAVMAVSPLVVAPAMRVEDCATLLLSANLRQAIVVQGGRPVGIVRDTDIFQAIESQVGNR